MNHFWMLNATANATVRILVLLLRYHNEFICKCLGRRHMKLFTNNTRTLHIDQKIWHLYFYNPKVVFILLGQVNLYRYHIGGWYYSFFFGRWTIKGDQQVLIKEVTWLLLLPNVNYLLVFLSCAFCNWSTRLLRIICRLGNTKQPKSNSFPQFLSR